MRTALDSRSVGPSLQAYSGKYLRGEMRAEWRGVARW